MITEKKKYRKRQYKYGPTLESYIAEVDGYYVNYLNLGTGKLIKLQDLKTESFIPQLHEEMKFLRITLRHILQDLKIYKMFPDRIEKINERKKLIVDKIIDLKQETKLCRQAKRECITYLAEQLEYIKQLHPNVNFIKYKADDLDVLEEGYFRSL